MPPRLPSAFDDVLIPALFAPTAIARAGGCRLRSVLGSSPRVVAALPSGPWAELGTLGHQVLERHARVGGDPGPLFDACSREASERLGAEPITATYADLPSVVGLVTWSRFRAEILARCPSRPVRLDAPIHSASASSRYGSERTIVSPDLRLRGRPDFTRRSGAILEVRDHKTGEIAGRDGKLKPEIVIQLWCYGLLALERDPDLEVRLLIDDGTEREIPFGANEQKRARRTLARMMRGLTAGRRMDAVALAAPGACCADCPFRHRCPAYRQVAPTWWRLGPGTPGELARDVWGVVVEAKRDPKGRWTILLEDAAMRHVRIDQLDPRHGVDETIVGRDIWFFALESIVSRRAPDGRCLQPTSFHELPADSTQRRAWCLRVHA